MENDDTRMKSQVRDFLHRSHSFLGRLIEVAGLWNHASGHYDLNLPEHFHGADIDRTVADWHTTFFNQWLALSLEEKETDPVAYWESLGRPADLINRIRAIAEAAIPPLTNSTRRQDCLQDCLHDLILLSALFKYKAK